MTTPTDPFGPEEFNPGVNYVGELLAVLHSDGGHYTNAHGVNKAAFDALQKHYDLLRRAESAEHKLTQGNPYPRAAVNALTSAAGGRDLLYFHPKSGAVYLKILRRAACSPLFEGDVVFLFQENSDSLKALVTDPINIGEDVMFYQDIVSGEIFARPARMFDEPGRFVVFESYMGEGGAE